MEWQELLARVGQAAITNRQAQRALQRSEQQGNYQQARKDREAAASAQRALDALLIEADQAA